ncbi:tyrosinase family oxidase copper chaperone [Streptomyces sp. NPDC020192]|uniref:tyrosinase family oxidase copper chaperone n=1 Tax=Streptomyces sp. NPDC020192 TaxID=3365066 RepID=UPI00379D96E2
MAPSSLPPHGQRHHAQSTDGTCFDETYRGCRIQGVLVPVGGREASGGDWRITIDGRPLHLMRRTDGTWPSKADHYTSYRAPLEATRAAVGDIGPGRRLRDTGRETGGGHMGHVMGDAISFLTAVSPGAERWQIPQGEVAVRHLPQRMVPVPRVAVAHGSWPPVLRGPRRAGRPQGSSRTGEPVR